MKLTDVMSGAGLAIYAEIALIIFLVVFLLIALRTWWPTRRKELEDHGGMPLDDGRQAGAAHGRRTP
ncbi:MAG: hypothetical protein GMKNLPBB_00765 [Myxococcota bacterium]|nr:hypothetical protein [Myxococcota bacterium]